MHTCALQEDAKRNDLIGEYTGELVGQAEADRRGTAYDRDGSSYLFNLDQDWVLDAHRRGNKLRFVNHRRARVWAAHVCMLTAQVGSLPGIQTCLQLSVVLLLAGHAAAKCS